MVRKRSDPEVIITVTYVTDPQNARAAQAILAEGLRRALNKAIHEKSLKEKRDAAS